MSSPPYSDPEVMVAQGVTAWVVVLAIRRRRLRTEIEWDRTPFNAVDYGFACLLYGVATFVVAWIANGVTLADYQRDRGSQSFAALVVAWLVFKFTFFLLAFITAKTVMRSLADAIREDWTFRENDPRGVRRRWLLAVGVAPSLCCLLPLSYWSVDGYENPVRPLILGMLCAIATTAVAWRMTRNGFEEDDPEFLAWGTLKVMLETLRRRRQGPQIA